MKKTLIEEIEKSAVDSELARMRLRAEKAEKQVIQEANQRRSAEALLERQLEQIEGLRKPRVKLPPGRPGKAIAGDFCRVMIPDTHGSHVDPQAAAAMLADLEVLKPKEVILMGDHIDCGGFLAQHQVMGFVAETEYTFEDDVSAASELLDSIQKRVPSARFDYLEGNHEHRLERWCVTSALRNTRDAKYLRNLFSPTSVLSLEKRNIAYASLYKYHDGLPIQGAIKRGACHYVHGISHAKHAADVTLSKFGGNVCFAHTHRAEDAVTTIVGSGTIGAWGFGCLCKLQPYYLHGKPSGHSHGYGLQFVRYKTGKFITLQVPIINGESLLQPLFGAVLGRAA